MAESGLFYSLFIDPLVKSMRGKVAAQIQQGETVIDIACGTGVQVFLLKEKAKRAVGIDLSESMIKVAQKKALKNKIENVRFVLADAANLIQFAENEFDVAIMSLALHQFSPEIYTPILNEMKRVSQRIVMVDYTVPLPNNFAGLASKIIEFMAGREHNRNFIKYYKLGGLNNILNQNGLVINRSQYFGGGAFSLVNCSENSAVK